MEIKQKKSQKSNFQSYTSIGTSTGHPFVSPEETKYFQQQQQIFIDRKQFSMNINPSNSTNYQPRYEKRSQQSHFLRQQETNERIYSSSELILKKNLYRYEIEEELVRTKFPQSILCQLGYQKKFKRQKPLQRIIYPSYRRSVQMGKQLQSKQSFRGNYFKILKQLHQNQIVYLLYLFIKTGDAQNQILRRFTVLPRIYYNFFKFKLLIQNNKENYFLLGNYIFSKIDLSNLVIDVQISELVSLRWYNLVILDLQNCGLEDKGWKQLSFQVIKYPQLRKIFLNNNKITHIQKNDFNTFLDLQYLEMLNLQSNHFLTTQSLQVIKKIQYYNKQIGKFQLSNSVKKQPQQFDPALLFIKEHQLMEPEEIESLEKALRPQSIKFSEEFQEILELIYTKLQSLKDKFSLDNLLSFIINNCSPLFQLVSRLYPKKQTQYPSFDLILDYIEQAAQKIWSHEYTKIKQKVANFFTIIKKFMNDQDKSTKYGKLCKLVKYIISRFMILSYKKTYVAVDKQLVWSMSYTKKLLTIFFDVFLWNVFIIWGTFSDNESEKQKIRYQRIKALQRILSYQDQDVEKYQQIKLKMQKGLDNQLRKEMWKLYHDKINRPTFN